MHALAMRPEVRPVLALPLKAMVPGREILRSLTTIVLALAVVSTAGCPHQPEKLTTLPVVATDDPQAEAHMRAAREAEEEGHTKEARTGYESFLEEHPDDPLAAVARLGLGRILLAEGQVEAARGHFEAVADHSDSAVAERARFYLGIAHHLSGQHQAAIETLDPYVGKTVDPEDTALLLQTIAAAAIHVGDRVRAVEAYDQLAGSPAPEEAREEARQRITTLVDESATPEEIRVLYDRLPHGGTAWPLVAVRAAKEAYSAGETSRAAEILTALEEEDVPLDEELQELAVRVERTGKADPGVIGAILPLSGRGRKVGQQALRGLMLAAGAPHEGPIPEDAPQVVFRDDAGDPAQAAKAVEDLVTLHQAIAIIGPVDAAASSEAAKRAQELGVPLITLTPASGITEAGALVFRLFFTPESEARELVTAARERGARRFAVLHPSNSFGQTMRDAYARQVRGQGAQLVASVSYEPGSTSFAGAIRKLRAKRFDALFVPDSFRTVRLVAPALAAAGLWSRAPGQPAPEDGRSITLLVPSVGYGDGLATEASRYLQGALFSRPFDPQSASGRDFAERFQLRFGEKPDVFAAYAYDAFHLVRRSIESGARTREELADRLGGGRRRTTAAASAGLASDRGPMRGTQIYELRGETLRRIR